MKLIEKTIVICITIILFTSCVAYAVNYKTISIDIPSNYTKLTDYYYQSSDGEVVINIVFTEKSISATESDIYTESNLKTFSSSIKEETITSVKESVRERIEEAYGKIDDETFNSFYENISFDINSNEITNVGKNNYKAFKFDAVLKTLDVTQYEVMYTIFTKTGSYNVCIASSDKSYFNSNEFVNMINSIEISNPLSKSSAKFSTDLDWGESIEKAVSAGISVLIIGGISAFCGLFKKKGNEEKDKNKENIEVKEKVQEKEQDNKVQNKEKNLIKCKVCGKEIPFNDKNICDECHKKELEQLEKNKEEVEPNKDKQVNLTNNVDNIQLIKKYKELLEEGIITEEEFNEKKKQLLDL